MCKKTNNVIDIMIFILFVKEVIEVGVNVYSMYKKPDVKIIVESKETQTLPEVPIQHPTKCGCEELYNDGKPHKAVYETYTDLLSGVQKSNDSAIQTTSKDKEIDTKIVNADKYKPFYCDYSSDTDDKLPSR